MTKINEIWKDIKGFEGLYQISNLGRVKSLKRIIQRSSSPQSIKERIIKIGLNRTGKRGYYNAGLFINGIGVSKLVHLLVWDHFGNADRVKLNMCVDHIDNNKLNNQINNLQLLSNRDNITKINKRDLPIGVVKESHRRKYYSYITVSKKRLYLGSFNNSDDAGIAYKKAKLQLCK